MSTPVNTRNKHPYLFSFDTKHSETVPKVHTTTYSPAKGFSPLKKNTPGDRVLNLLCSCLHFQFFYLTHCRHIIITSGSPALARSLLAEPNTLFSTLILLELSAVNTFGSFLIHFYNWSFKTVFSSTLLASPSKCHLQTSPLNWAAKH